MRRADTVTHSVGDTDHSDLSECDRGADAEAHPNSNRLAITQSQRIADAELPPAATRDRQCALTLTIRA